MADYVDFYTFHLEAAVSVPLDCLFHLCQQFLILDVLEFVADIVVEMDVVDGNRVKVQGAVRSQPFAVYSKFSHLVEDIVYGGYGDPFPSGRYNELGDGFCAGVHQAEHCIVHSQPLRGDFQPV